LYREAWRRWEVFVGAESIAEDLGSVTVGEWRASLAKLAPNTFHRAMGTVKTVYAWAYRAHLIGRNDVREYRHKVAKEKVRPRPAEYRQDEFKALLLQFPLEGTTTWRPHLALTLCGYQGVRQNAVLHLRWEDVDLDAATITWRARWDKVGREWSQPLRPAPLAALRAVQARTGAITGWVFPPANRRSRREVWSAQSLWRAIRDAEDKAGITHHAYRGAHGLRRMVFNDALRAGADVASALAVIGDKDLAVANTYLRPREDAIRAAFALLDKEPS
jgi:integrase